MHWCFATNLPNPRKPGLTSSKSYSATSTIRRRLPRFEAYVTVQHVKGVRFLGAKSTPFLQKHPGILRKGPRLDNNKKIIFATVRVRHRRLALLIKLFCFSSFSSSILILLFLSSEELEAACQPSIRYLISNFFFSSIRCISPSRLALSKSLNFLPTLHPKTFAFPCCLANLPV